MTLVAKSNRRPKERLHPLTKQKFLEGTRQKWGLFFVFIGLTVLGVCAFFPHIDPTPFMTFFTTVGALYMLGASVDSALKIQKTDPEANPPPSSPQSPESNRGQVDDGEEYV